MKQTNKQKKLKSDHPLRLWKTAYYQGSWNTIPTLSSIRSLDKNQALTVFL